MPESTPDSTSQSTRPRPVVLCVLDGWGHRESCEANAICLADTPVLDEFYATCPHGLIDASEHEVGLPEGQMGNSEVGHMNLGAGRVVLQDLLRIDQAVSDGSLTTMPAFTEFVAKLKKSGGTAHVMGLLSPGGVHSQQRHMAALASALIEAGVPVAVHAFLDGRDTPPRSALDYIAAFREEAPEVRFASISGRYYAMDRDKRWDRVARAYAVLTEGEGAEDAKVAADAETAVRDSYTADAGDEFVAPTAIAGYRGMADGDGVLMANFRADRVREILTALLDSEFKEFARRRVLRFTAAAGMVRYSDELDRLVTAIFPPQDLDHSLGEVVAEAGLRQLRIAETEKYAHVTFFLNGGREAVFEGEERILVPSPKVATYDLQPEMSAPEVTDRLVEAIDSDRFDLIVVNYANGDMVGHTGNLQAAIKAVETVDHCLGRLADALRQAGGCMIVTADHGNAEQMTDKQTGQAHTAHTMNRVPAILVNGPARVQALADGRLADIAPTLLALMGLPPPAAMTGLSLLRDAADRGADRRPARDAAAE
ncbi:MAG: 2,3-bisphosphoglycerate-independent phosphoglycerate mutase [Kiloniellales bacterium]